MTSKIQKHVMIPISKPEWQGSDWKISYADAVQDPKTLLRMLSLPHELLPAALIASQQFPLRVPREFIAKMQMSDPDDPLLLQVLPLHAELISDSNYNTDPVSDKHATVTPGLLHKYHGRVLVITTGACAVNCRYCFRRHFPYSENSAIASQWPLIEQYIRQDSSISEVILSGGDPLSLSDDKISEIIDRIAALPHVRRIRIHTRLPIMIPRRISSNLLASFSRTRLKIVMVMHVNHANEIDSEIIEISEKLRQNRVHLLNQAVLLRRVNDSLVDLVNLSEALFEAGILPYYIHLLDKVKGASHFDVSEHRAYQLMTQLNAALPGYLVPKLVKDVGEAAAKQTVVD